MRVCNQPGCPTLSPTPQCPAHTPKPWATSNRRSQLPTNWNKLRAKALKRDKACVQCGTTQRLEVDHISNPLDHSLTNLQVLCHDCHRTKTLAEAAAAKAARR